MRLLPILVVGLAVLGPLAAEAADLAPPPGPKTTAPAGFGILSEARLGVFAHDPWSPEQGRVDVNGELLSVRPFGGTGAWDVAIPRLHLGATVNTAGRTSHAYAGLTWTVDLGKNLFVEGALGGAFNNGAAGDIVPSGRNAMGCHASFRESASVGVRLTQQVSLMGTIEHLSNAGLCDRNRGLTNVGVRLGYSF